MLLLAATLAKGTTVLKQAAREPEIVDLARLPHRDGRADRRAWHLHHLPSKGLTSCMGATHPVVTDRIELGTYMLAPAFTGGEVECLGGKIELLAAFCEKLDEAGISVEQTPHGLKVKRTNADIKAISVTTEPFPGFPTDLQAQMMALLVYGQGNLCFRRKNI